MINFFKSSIFGGRHAKNVIYLNIVLLAGLGIPLILYPKSIGVLGVLHYGEFVYWCAFGAILGVLSDFGVSSIAVKEYCRVKSESKKSKILVNVWIVRWVVYTILLIIFLIIVFFSGKSKSNGDFFAISSVLAASMLFIGSGWYFQAVGRVHVYSLINLVSKGLTVLVIYAVPEEALAGKVFPLIFLVPQFLVVVFSDYSALKSINFRLNKVNRLTQFVILKKSYPLAIGAIANLIKDRLAIIIINLTIGAESVAAFDLAQKITELFANLYYNITRVLFPIFSAAKNPKLLKGLLFFGGATSVVVSLIISLCAAKIFEIAAPKINIEDSFSLSVLIFSLPALVLSSFVGHLGFVARGMVRPILFNTVVSATFYVLSLSGLYLFDVRSIVFVAVASLTGYFFETAHRFFLARKMGVL